MKTQNELSAFERFFAPKPKFFETIFNVLSMIAVLCSTLVYAAETVASYGFALPEKWLLVVSAASAVGAFIAQFTVDFDKYNPAKPRDEL